MAFQRNMAVLDRSIKVDQASIRAIIKALDKLPIELRKNAEKSVLRTGGNIILKAARAKAPVKSGLLKKALGVSVIAGPSYAEARIGVRSGVKYIYKNGKKTGRRSKYKKGKRIDAAEVAFYQETGTPKMAANPFIRPALDSEKGKVFSAMVSGLDTHLAKVAARLAKKA